MIIISRLEGKTDGSLVYKRGGLRLILSPLLQRRLTITKASLMLRREIRSSRRFLRNLFSPEHQANVSYPWNSRTCSRFAPEEKFH